MKSKLLKFVIFNFGKIIANCEYRCKTIAPLLSVKVVSFWAFPGIHKIQTMSLEQTQQGAVILTPNNRIVVFRWLS